MLKDTENAAFLMKFIEHWFLAFGYRLKVVECSKSKVVSQSQRVTGD
jgi:hypothetical protein